MNINQIPVAEDVIDTDILNRQSEEIFKLKELVNFLMEENIKLRFKKDTEMNINKFAVKIAKIEGLRKEVNIAQIKEILSVINNMTNGILYLIIKLMK